MATSYGNTIVSNILASSNGPLGLIIPGIGNASGNWSGNDQIYGSDFQQAFHSYGGTLYTDISYGRDTLNGGDGNDYVDGLSQNDSLSGGNGQDTVVGGAGNDFVHGNAGNDTVNGNDGVDTVHGGGDDDFLNGDAGNDIVSGDLGNDFVHGNADNDTVYGGDGTDTVLGGSGNDYVYGDAGNDHVSGDVGTDVLTGGTGADEFNFALGYGADTVTDFNRADGDHVLISSGSYSSAQVGANTVVTLSDGGTLTLLNVTLSSLDSGWIGS